MLPKASFLLLLILYHCFILPCHCDVMNGKSFCNKNDVNILKQICIKTAQRNDIFSYDKNTLVPNGSCSETRISESQTEDLLYCEYKSKPDFEKKQKLMKTKIFGRGIKMYDVMEYQITDDRVKPINNLTDYLKKVSHSYMKGQITLTLEEHKDFNGQDFCNTQRNKRNIFQKMCTKIAAHKLIMGYKMEDLTSNECKKLDTFLFSMDEGFDVKSEENAVYCSYNRKLSSLRNEQFESVVLGRGREGNDVMEYFAWQEGGNRIIAPYKNRIGFFTEVLSLQDHEVLEGKDFCSTQYRKYFGKMCNKLSADVRGLTEIIDTTFHEECSISKISLYSAVKGDDEVTLENLVICTYHYRPISRRDPFRTQSHYYTIEQKQTRALGRGKKENDVIEYLPYKIDETKQTDETEQTDVVYMANEHLPDFLESIKA